MIRVPSTPKGFLLITPDPVRSQIAGQLALLWFPPLSWVSGPLQPMQRKEEGPIVGLLGLAIC